MRTVIWPGHAYVPGRTPRHPEGFFDELRASVSEGMSVEELAESDAWIMGEGYFRAGFYWEAHEVWEPVWMALPPRSIERLVVQAAIQLANAGLKVEMERPKAAERLLSEVEALVLGVEGTVMGLPVAWFAEQLAAMRARLGGRPGDPEGD